MASLEEILRSVGFTGEGLRTALAVALAESGGNARAYNPTGKDLSYGLFQINMLGGMGPERRKKYGLASNEELYDPYVNARVAYDMSQGGRKWGPWTTYTSGKYQKYLGQSPNAQYDNQQSGTGAGAGSTMGGGETKKLDAMTLASVYGYSMAFFKSNPDLWRLINKAVTAQWTSDEFQAQLKNTAWYQKNSQNVREWYALERVDPATAKNKLGATAARLTQMANQQGVGMASKRVWDMAWRVNAYGWDDGQIATAMAAEMKFDPKHTEYIGGLGVKKAAIKEQAAAYGVDLTEGTIHSLMKQVVGQKTTDEAVLDYIKKMAKSKYTGLADDIDKGMTVQDYATPFIESQARLLELDPADVHLNDPSIAKALNYRDPKTGQPTPMTISQFEAALKNDPRWMRTKNARDSMMNGTRQILADWGLQ
jgi:hypothetical protein